jgi:aspartyl protease family protein
LVKTYSTPAQTIQVGQFADQDGSGFCSLHLQAPDQKTHLAINRDLRGSLVWLWIEGQPITASSTEALLSVSGGAHPYTINMIAADGSLVGKAPTGEFLHDLYNGKTLGILTIEGHAASFSLEGSTAALGEFAQCRDALVAAVPTVTAEQINHATRVPLDRHDSMWWLSVSLNGSNSFSFMLDSGAFDLAVPQWMFDKLQSQGLISEADYVRDVDAAMADGHTSKAKMYNLKSLTVGGRTVHDLTITIIPNNAEPLFGEAALQKFRSWSVDNATSSLVLI